MNFNGIKPLKILIVEDDLVDRKQLERMLSKAVPPTSEVRHTEYLENALELLDEDDFDIVLLDLNLPDSTGIDTLAKVNGKHPRVAIIVITGFDSEGLGLKLVAKGAQDYLIKGEFDSQTLKKSIFYSIERKKMEESLREERNKAKKYLDITGVMMIVLNEGSTLNLINNKSCEILGYAENEILGKDWCDNFVPPEHREEVREVLKGLMNGETSKYEYHENPVLAKSGKQRLIAWHNVVLWDENGKNYAVLSSGEDITERKKAEDTLRKTYKELEKANSEMKSMQAQLVQSEKLASIGQLAAGVAHEMNTPVGFTASNFETLENYMKKISKLLEMYDDLAAKITTVANTEILEKVDIINNARDLMHIDFILEDIQGLFDDSREGLQRVTNIIQNLRDFSRVDQTGDFSEYNINDGIKATLAIAKNEIKYDAEIKTEFGEVSPVFCNSGQINQVFLNILVNAAQAIKSRNREYKGTITIRTYQTEDEVICEIADDGPGIPPDNLTKIFDPFFTTKPVGKGTGLGLSISYDIIVTKHKGQILVDSTVGEGTKFTIKLPISGKELYNKDKKEELLGIENYG